MDTVLLEAVPRDKSVKTRELRNASLVPAEIYGSGQPNVSVQMDYQTFRKAYIAAGENTVIDLSVEGAQAPRKVLVHQVNFDTVTGKIKHVDFVNVDMNKEVHTHIPLEFVGTAPAVKDMSGTLMTHITELEVKCLPGDLIHKVKVDITGLVDFHTSIHVRDLHLPEAITVLDDLEATVASVAAPRVEEEEAPVVPAEGAEGAEGEAKVVEEGAEGEAKENGK